MAIEFNREKLSANVAFMMHGYD